MNSLPQDTHQKQCGKCKEYFSATPDFFYRDNSKKDGLCRTCKVCQRKSPKETIPEGMKKCSKCKNLLHATPEFFDRSSLQKSGLYPSCKQCEKAYRELNKEAIQARIKTYQPIATERMREYRKTEKNRAYRKERNTRIYREHRDKLLRQQKQYNDKNKAEINARRRQHRKNHPDLYQGIDRAHKHKRKAQKLAVGGSYTAQELREQLKRQHHKCYYCKTRLGKGKAAWHADHIVPLSRGGTNGISNIVCACPDCNMRKHDKLPHEWSDGGRLL